MEKKIQDGNVDPNNVNKEEEGQSGKEQPTPPTKVKEEKEETKTETKTEGKEQPKKETKEEKKVETYNDAISKVSAKYEKKLAEQKLKFEKQIKERDDVIAEMIVNGDDGKEIIPPTSVKDAIAKRRAYNKW